MKKKLSYILIAFTLFCGGCGTTTPDPIPVNLEDKNTTWEKAGKHFQIDELLPVSLGNTMIGNIDKILLHDAGLFVLDQMQNAIFLLNPDNGEVRTLLHRLGRAKDEYLSIDDFTVDNQGNLYILDNKSKKINQYNPDGKYLRTIQAGSGTAIAVADNGHIAVYRHIFDPENQIVIYDADGKEVQSASTETPLPRILLSNGASVIKMQDQFLFCNPFENSLYLTTDDGCEKLTTFDFDPYNTDIERMRNLDPQEVNKVLMNNDEVFFLHHLSHYKDLLFFSTSRQDVIVYDMKQQTASCVSATPSPYRILFAEPLSVDAKGRFCSILRDNNIRQGLFPLIEHDGSEIKALEEALKQKDQRSDFWLLKGHIVE